MTLARALEHLSISDRLLRLGYTHEGRGPGQPHIIRDAAGADVGHMHAYQAVEFIHKIEAQRLAAE